MSTKRHESSPAILGAAGAVPRIPDKPTDLPQVDRAYRAWRAAETQCDRALRGWLDAGPGDGRVRYAAYGAALDREETAARHLQRVCEPAQGDTSD
jgi:hypothetical protein